MRRTEPQGGSDRFHHAIVLATAGGVFVLVCWGVAALESVLDDPRSLHAWLQMLAGSTWPPGWDDPDHRASFAFAIGVAWHFTLNVAPAIGVIWIFWAVLEQRREYMQLRDLFRLRDESIKGRVADAVKHSDALSEEQRQSLGAAIDSAYDAGASYWDGTQLPALVGRRLARMFWKRPVEGE